MNKRSRDEEAEVSLEFEEERLQCLLDDNLRERQRLEDALKRTKEKRHEQLLATLQEAQEAHKREAS